VQRLIYASRHDIADADLDEEVGAIVRASIRNNREVAITGLLLVHGGRFVQALEGPAAAVEQTYHRILADPRHRDSKILKAARAPVRMFADWNMCARRITPADDAILDTLSQRASFTPETLNGDAAERLLTTVRDIQARTQLASLA
jgi:hypothetical protein